MIFTLIILIVLFALLLSILKLTGLVGWSWVMILKIVGYPSAFLGVLVGLILAGVLFVRLVRMLLEWKDKQRSE